MLSGEATNINFLVIGLTRSGLEPMIYHNQGGHHWKPEKTTDLPQITDKFYDSK
jgi:hypothetical protein